MKKLLPFLTSVLAAGSAMAGIMVDGVEFQTTSVATNTAQISYTNTALTRGKVLAIEIQVPAGTTGTYSVATQDGMGASISGSKTLYASTVLTADVSTNLAAVYYLTADHLVLTYSNSCSTAVQPKVVVVVDLDN